MILWGKRMTQLICFTTKGGVLDEGAAFKDS